MRILNCEDAVVKCTFLAKTSVNVLEECQKERLGTNMYRDLAKNELFITASSLICGKSNISLKQSSFITAQQSAFNKAEML